MKRNFKFNVKKYSLDPRTILFSIKNAHDVVAEVSKFKGNASGDLYLSLLPRIAEANSTAFELICGIPEIRSYDDFYKADFIRSVEIERELLWQAGSLNIFYNEINSFTKAVQDYTKTLLLKPGKESLGLIEGIVEKFGFSIWSIENKIAVLSLVEGPDGIKKYTNSILEEKDVHAFFKTIVEKLSDRALPTLSWKRYDALIDTLTQELKDTGKESTANYISFNLNYYNTNVADSANIILAGENLFSINDRYLAFLRCVQTLDTSSKDKHLISALKKAVNFLGKKIDDIYLHSIIKKYGEHKLCEEKNSSFIDAFDKYTTGDYSSCIATCESILEWQPHLTELYDIYVRSAYRLNVSEIVFKSGSLMNKILNLMLKILPKNEDSKDSYYELMKLVYIFPGLPCMANIFYFCCREFRSCTKDKYRQMKRYAELNSVYLSPRAIAYYNSINRSADSPVFENITVKFLYNAYLGGFEEVKALSIPEYRKLKYIARMHEACNNPDRAIEIYSILEASPDQLTVIEAILAKTELYLLCGDVGKCLDFIVDRYFKYQLPVSKFPLKELLFRIESQRIYGISSKIEFLIAYDLYNKYVSSDKLAKMYDAFDDFIYTHGFEKPSDILNATEFPPQYVLYFLKYICIPDVMDASDCFRANNEVLDERVKICLTLQEIDQLNYSLYVAEVEEILTSMIIAKASSKIGSGRIFIDIAGITKLKKSEFVDSFQKYISLPDVVEGGAEFIPYDETGERFLPGSPKDQVLISIFEELTGEFIHNRDYGLDGNLSLEIRHGQLETMFWVPLEKLNLVAKKDDKGNYKRNEYWWRVYEIFLPYFRGEIDSALMDFSKGIDDTIETLKKEWFVAKARSGNFSFALDAEDFAAIKSRLIGITDYDVFYSVLTEIAIDITETNLKELRQKVYKEVPLLFDDKFSTLTIKLFSIKQDLALNELEAQIALGRNEIHTAVDELVNLLDFGNKHNSPDFEIYLPIMLSTDAFKNTYSHKNIQFNIEATKTPMIQGRYLHDFVRIFLTLFDNIIRRSGLEALSSILLSASCNEGQLTISIVNNVSVGKDLVEIRSILDEIKKKLRTRTYSDSVNKEGRSGFYKIDKILSVNLGCDHAIDFDINDDYIFKVILQVNIERICA